MKNKKYIVYTLFIMFIGLPTHSKTLNQVNFLGDFKERVLIPVIRIDRQDCEDYEGYWNNQPDSMICLVPASNNASISLKDGKYHIDINTMGQNTHTCSYSGEAYQISSNQLFTQSEVTLWKNDQEMIGYCEIKVTFKENDLISIDNNGNCNEFCGMNAELLIERGKRTP